MNNLTNKTCKTIAKCARFFELNIIFRGNKDETKGQSFTIHVFIEDEVEELNKSILVFIQEDVRNTRVHFFHQPWLQLFWVVLRLQINTNAIAFISSHTHQQVLNHLSYTRPNTSWTKQMTTANLESTIKHPCFQLFYKLQIKLISSLWC